MENFDLYLFTGNLGTGKSTAADKVARSLGVPVLDPDLIRCELGMIRYDPADTPRVMREIFARKIAAISRGESVVMATPYVRRISRQNSYELITELSASLGRQLMAVLVECYCAESIAKRRISSRLKTDASHHPPTNPNRWDSFNAQTDPIVESEMTANPQFSFLSYDTDTNAIKRLAIHPNMMKAVDTLERCLYQLSTI